MAIPYDSATYTFDSLFTDYDGNEEAVVDDNPRLHYPSRRPRPRLGRNPLAERRTLGGTPGRR